MLKQELVEYADNVLRLRIPAGLRKTRGMYVFEPRRTSRRWPGKSVTLSMDPPDALLSAYSEQIQRMPALSDSTMERQIVSQGECQLRPGALERVIIVRHKPTNNVEYSWEILFRVEGHPIYVQIYWPGDFCEDRPVWEEVVKSIEILK